MKEAHIMKKKYAENMMSGGGRLEIFQVQFVQSTSSPKACRKNIPSNIFSNSGDNVLIKCASNLNVSQLFDV